MSKWHERKDVRGNGYQQHIAGKGATSTVLRMLSDLMRSSDTLKIFTEVLVKGDTSAVRSDYTLSGGRE